MLSMSLWRCISTGEMSWTRTLWEGLNTLLMVTSKRLYLAGVELILLYRYPLELHMVHRNIHDETVSEALEHENGLTVLGFKFQLVKDSEDASEGMDTLAEIAEKFLVDTGSKFSQGDIEKEVIV